VCEIFTGPQNKRGSAMKEIGSNAQRAVDALRREYEAITNIPLIVKLVGDVCAANLALVVPALTAEDLASKPVTYHYEPNAVLHAVPIWTKSLCDMHAESRAKARVGNNRSRGGDLARANCRHCTELRPENGQRGAQCGGDRAAHLVAGTRRGLRRAGARG
jgi:hypothetical protein